MGAARSSPILLGAAGTRSEPFWLSQGVSKPLGEQRR